MLNRQRHAAFFENHVDVIDSESIVLYDIYIYMIIFHMNTNDLS